MRRLCPTRSGCRMRCLRCGMLTGRHPRRRHLSCCGTTTKGLRPLLDDCPGLLGGPSDFPDRARAFPAQGSFPDFPVSGACSRRDALAALAPGPSCNRFTCRGEVGVILLECLNALLGTCYPFGFSKLWISLHAADRVRNFVVSFNALIDSFADR